MACRGSHAVRRRAIGGERRDRLETALAAGEPGDAECLLVLLAGRAYEEAGADLARADKPGAVQGYVSNNHCAIENYRIVPLASSGLMEKGVNLVVRNMDPRPERRRRPRRAPRTTRRATAGDAPRQR